MFQLIEDSVFRAAVASHSLVSQKVEFLKNYNITVTKKGNTSYTRCHTCELLFRIEKWHGILYKLHGMLYHFCPTCEIQETDAVGKRYLKLYWYERDHYVNVVPGHQPHLRFNLLSSSVFIEEPAVSFDYSNILDLLYCLKQCDCGIIFSTKSTLSYFTQVCPSCNKKAICTVCGSKDVPHPYENGKCLTCTPIYTPLPWDYKMHPIHFYGETPPYFGLEVEINTPHFNDYERLVHFIYKKYIDQKKFFIIKNDGTIKPGFEIVFQPMTFDFIKEYDLTWLFKLESVRAVNHPNQGIHIHISRKDFTPLSLFKFCKFIYLNIGFTCFIGERLLNEYCKPALIAKSLARSLKDTYNTTRSDFIRRRIINNQNEKTVELRFFNTNLTPANYYKNIEFAHALFSFSKIFSMNDMTVDKFINWVSEKDYPNLKRFLYFYSPEKNLSLLSLSPLLRMNSGKLRKQMWEILNLDFNPVDGENIT